mgnify:CR=1 FL=1
MRQITMPDRHSQTVAAAPMTEHPIPYPADPVALFAALRERLPAPVWLDGAAGGQTSLVAADPSEVLVTRADGTRRWPRAALAAGSVGALGGGAMPDAPGEWLGRDDPLALLQGRLDARAARRGLAGAGAAAGADPVAPFTSGAIGYFSYELGRRLQGQLPGPDSPPAEGPTPAASATPDMAVGLYDWAIRLDHAAGEAWLCGQPPAGLADWLAGPWMTSVGGAAPRPGIWQAEGPIEATPEWPAYRHAFARVMHYLREGDCYQINLARRLRAPFSGDPLGVYARFRRLAGGPFAAYLDLPGGPVLSGSPERFLQLRDGRVETCPIKGTRRREAAPEADARVREALLASAKDRAENVMIVDLLRNDIGRSCATGSVRVPTLCSLESFATVHHMVSTVTGQLAAGRRATDLLRDCLPGGSITGAPKYRAMEIIAELEGEPRGVYCGAIGYIGDDGGMDTSIAIRTLTARDGWLEYRAGGGLVVDSQCEDEFEETESKAAAFRRLIEEATPGFAAGRQSRSRAVMMQSQSRSAPVSRR